MLLLVSFGSVHQAEHQEEPVLNYYPSHQKSIVVSQLLERVRPASQYFVQLLHAGGGWWDWVEFPTQAHHPHRQEVSTHCLELQHWKVWVPVPGQTPPSPIPDHLQEPSPCFLSHH